MPPPADAPDSAEALASRLEQLESRLKNELDHIDRRPPSTSKSTRPTATRRTPTPSNAARPIHGRPGALVTPSAPRSGSQPPPPSLPRPPPPSVADTSSAPPSVAGTAPPSVAGTAPPSVAGTAPLHRTGLTDAARLALGALRQQRAGLQQERAALAQLLQSHQTVASELRSGLEQVQALQEGELQRSANALQWEREANRRAMAAQRAEAAAQLSQCQEERGEAMLRAEQVRAEACGVPCFSCAFSLLTAPASPAALAALLRGDPAT